MVNNTVLKDLLKDYDKKQQRAVHDVEVRKKELFSRIPRLQDIENELNIYAIQTAKSILSSNTSSALVELQKKVDELKEERALLLKKDCKSLDYLSPIYECSKCNDTGYILDNGNTVMCSCLKQKLLNIEYNSSNIGNLDRENFKRFNINLYSDEVNEEKYNSDISPRDNIKMIGKETKKFIRNFDSPNEKNLLFSGGTGLGKTFLSNCIVAELLSMRKNCIISNSSCYVGYPNK